MIDDDQRELEDHERAHSGRSGSRVDHGPLERPVKEASRRGFLRMFSPSASKGELTTTTGTSEPVKKFLEKAATVKRPSPETTGAAVGKFMDKPHTRREAMETGRNAMAAARMVNAVKGAAATAKPAAPPVPAKPVAVPPMSARSLTLLRTKNIPKTDKFRQTWRITDDKGRHHHFTTTAGWGDGPTGRGLHKKFHVEGVDTNADEIIGSAISQGHVTQENETMRIGKHWLNDDWLHDE